MLVYLDDFVLLGRTNLKPKETQFVVNLLSKLAFGSSTWNSVLLPSRQMEFLEFYNRYRIDEATHSYGEASARELGGIVKGYNGGKVGEDADAGGSSGELQSVGPSGPFLVASLTGVDSIVTGLDTKGNTRGKWFGTQSNLTQRIAFDGARMVDRVPQRLVGNATCRLLHSGMSPQTLPTWVRGCLVMVENTSERK